MHYPWFRLYNELISDPKFRVIARRANQRVGDVIAVTLHVLTAANEGDPRGDASKLNESVVAVSLELDDSDVDAILEGLQGFILKGRRVINWEKRQPSPGAERQRLYRERCRDTTEQDAASKPERVRPVKSERDEAHSKRFETDFWPVYPRHTDKQDARRAWIKHIKPSEVDAVLVAAKLYAIQVSGKDVQYIKHAATWLANNRWRDTSENHEALGMGTPTPSKGTSLLPELGPARFGEES